MFDVLRPRHPLIWAVILLLTALPLRGDVSPHRTGAGPTIRISPGGTILVDGTLFGSEDRPAALDLISRLVEARAFGRPERKPVLQIHCDSEREAAYELVRILTAPHVIRSESYHVLFSQKVRITTHYGHAEYRLCGGGDDVNCCAWIRRLVQDWLSSRAAVLETYKEMVERREPGLRERLLQAYTVQKLQIAQVNEWINGCH